LVYHGNFVKISENSLVAITTSAGNLGLTFDEHLTFYDQICLYYLKCTKFCQLILRKIIKIVATRCQILRLRCTKFNFGWGSAPDPAGGAYSALPSWI